MNRVVLEQSLGGGSGKTPTKLALFQVIYEIEGVCGQTKKERDRCPAPFSFATRYASLSASATTRSIDISRPLDQAVSND